MNRLEEGKEDSAQASSDCEEGITGSVGEVIKVNSLDSGSSDNNGTLMTHSRAERLLLREYSTA